MAREDGRNEWDEITEVLATLRRLARKVVNPTIRVCLEAAHEDIEHLTGESDEEIPD